MKNEMKETFNKVNPSPETKARIYQEIIQKSQISSGRRTTTMERKFMIRKICIAALMAVVVLGASGSVYAAIKWMNASETADNLGNKKLAEAFGKQEKDIIEESAGDYTVAYLGVVSGVNISDLVMPEEIDDSKMYATVAIKKQNGEDMTYEDEIMVSPFIQGLAPWEYNIATMNGGAWYNIVDGVQYRIIEVDNIEIFADRELYLGVTDSNFGFAQCYQYDEATGKIGRNEAYDGLNLLFKLDVDKSKADSAAAEEYINNMFHEIEE